MNEEVSAPLISIIIPVFNHAAYVADCLNSILADDYPNKEIIILNDGSTDGSAEVIRDWILQNSNSKNIVHVIFLTQENKGICAGLNSMIARAKGEYIRPLAGDDRLIPGMLKQHLQFLQAHPTKLVAFADARVIDNDGGIIKASALTEHLSHHKSSFLSEKLLKNTIILKGKIIPNLLIKKIFYDDFHYPVELIMEDNYFLLTAIAKTQLVFFDAVVADYRVHGANLSYKIAFNEPVERTKKRLKINRSLLQSYQKTYSSFIGFDKILVLYAWFKIFIKISILKAILIFKEIFKSN